MAPSEFEKLLESFVKSLDVFKASLDQYDKAISEQEQAKQHKGEPEPQRVVQSIVSLPPAVIAYYDSEQKERPQNKGRERVTRLLEVGGVLVALVLAVLTYLTLQKISSQADSAQQQVVIMQRQARTADIDLMLAERAYLAFGEPRQELLGRQGPVFIPIINSGHIPVVRPVLKIVYTRDRVEPGNPNHIEKKSWTRTIERQYIFPGPGFNLVLNPPRLSNADTLEIEKHRESEYIVVTGGYNPGFSLAPEAFTFCI